MDAARFARWKRRQIGRAVGGIATSLLAFSPLQPASAKKKHCGKHKQRCKQFCTAMAPPLCAQCGSSAGCLADERCFPTTCGQGVTAVCRQICGE